MVGRSCGMLGIALALAACGSSAPPSASRSVIPADPDTITVDGGTTLLVVTREPFHLSFRDASGTPMLESAGSATIEPRAVVQPTEPAPLGGELPKGPTLYAPLAFVVGTQHLAQIPGGPWEANILAGTAAGVAFHATRVEDVQAVAGSVELTVATNDPSGRTLKLAIAPAGNGGVRVSVRPQPADGVTLMSDAFGALPTDAFRGFGGRHHALDQRGHDFTGWVQQQNTGAGYFQPLADVLPGGGENYLFPNGASAAYYVAPQFVSQRYSFLLERDELSRWRMGSDADEAWQVSVAAPALDYSVVTGAPQATIAALTQLTGRHRAPPPWVTGVILDRSTIPFTQTPAQYEQQVRDDLAKIAELGLTVSGYRIEGWFELAPEVRRELAAEFHGRGISVLAYFRAFVAPDTAGTEDPAVFQEAIGNGYVATTAAGTPYLFGGNFFGPSALIDFTNPDALVWWKDRIKAVLDEGVDGFMQDFGEQTMGDMQFADGRNGMDLHNGYLRLYHRATREAIDEWLVSHPGHDDIWFFTRAGYAGLDGTAAYEGSNFAGDGNTDFSRSSGLAAQAPDMLNRAIGGAYGFTTDIGGYFDFVSPATTKELFIRWAQWAVLSPVMRLHGSVNAGTHMPWIYDAETVGIWKQLTALRLRAQPLIQRLWTEAAATSTPITRPLWLAYPDDTAAATQDQQWLLGPDVLVAPVVTEGATARAVYFPAGCWQHGSSGAQYNGPAAVEVPAPLNELPYFFRCGTKPF